jgi:hypothetical protein
MSIVGVFIFNARAEKSPDLISEIIFWRRANARGEPKIIYFGRHPGRGASETKTSQARRPRRLIARWNPQINEGLRRDPTEKSQLIERQEQNNSI